MLNLVRSGEIPASRGGTITFVGEEHGAAVSMFLVNTEPGLGPPLHRHPYPETWVVRTGRAVFRADSEEAEVGPGDIITVAATTPHRFTVVGDERADMICIHASPTFIQEDLE